jgi:hypothetical protein
MGATTKLAYDRRDQSLLTSFYMLSSDLHARWRNVSEATIRAVARAEKTGNKIWWKNGDFRSTRIDAEAVLKKHGARIVERRQSDIGDE